MNPLLQKIPLLAELFLNGIFILLYSLRSTNKIPPFFSSKFMSTALHFGVWYVPIILFLSIVVNFISAKGLEGFLRKHVFSLIVFVPLLITFGDMEFTFWLGSVHLLSSVLTLYDGEQQEKQESFSGNQRTFLQKLELRPAQVVLLSFMGLISLGTFLLMLPVSAAEGFQVTFIDALFMSTSATCVTGLATISVAKNLSIFGQMVILLLLQIGGLGIMTLSSSMTILLGRAMGMKDRIIMQDLLDVSSLEDLYDMIIDIIKYTFFIELWGGILLTIGFTFEGYEMGTAIYYGFFHSISAFCNAGLSLFDTSLESFATSPIIHGTIAFLIVLGGVGFIVLRELREIIYGKKISRLGVHAKIVLVTTFLLIVAGAVFIFFGEFLNSLDSYTLWEKTQIAIFQSITTRTAGFNTISLTSLHSYTIYGLTLFMFIGGSPGSTAGGIKTSTFAILIQSIKSTLKGKKEVTVFDRTIPAPIVVRAIVITFISIITSSLFLLVLMKLEPDQSFLTLFFETISAFGTVGLSLGVTPFLTVGGKVILAILMFIGRVGPLTLVLGIGEKASKSGKLDYPDGRVMIG